MSWVDGNRTPDIAIIPPNYSGYDKPISRAIAQPYENPPMKTFLEPILAHSSLRQFVIVFLDSNTSSIEISFSSINEASKVLISNQLGQTAP